MADTNQEHIFDDVFRTLEEHTPELMIPLINEVFHTDYPEDTVVTKLSDKHHLLLKLLETDSYLGIEDKVYHFECESNPNTGVIAIRMFQYDVTVALERKQKISGSYIVEFPESCVIYLRHKKSTKEKEQVIIRLADGQEFTYRVPVIKSQRFSKEELFEKKLYVLFPYYILKYEKELPEFEEEEEKRLQLLGEYEDICQRLKDTLGVENPLTYQELLDSMRHMLEYILREYTEIKEGAQQIMGGKVLESWQEKTLRQGREQGREELLISLVETKIAKGKSVAVIAEELEKDISEIQLIYDKLISTGE